MRQGQRLFPIVLGLFIAIFGLWVRSPTLFAAEFSVPNLELSDFGKVSGDTFNLSSVASADIAIAGGYKYGGLLRLSFTSKDLEKALGYSRTTVDPISAPPSAGDYNALADRLNNQAVMGFKLAQVTARKPFELPVEFSYFIGMADNFCSGDDFPQRFGTAPVGTNFRGLSYFPNGIGGNPAFQYNGIYEVVGSGISVTLTPWESIIPSFYLYQDDAFINSTTGIPDSGRFSSDMRVLVNSLHVKLEAFAGATAPYGGYGMYRGGVLALFTTGTGADFLAQVGVPGWDGGSSFSIDNLFFLFEPRLDFGPAAIHITLFYHPLRYMQILNPTEQGATDLNVQLLVGNILKNGLEGGLETTTGIHPHETPTFSLRISPFLSAITEGARWDFKIRIDPLSYGRPIEMFETYMGVRTSF
jgi:hypothetical protein